jgi:hypothetical protein
MDQDGFNVSEFCSRHGFARGTFYNFLRAGKGPRIIKVGRRTIVGREAAEAWRRDHGQATLRCADGAVRF